MGMGMGVSTSSDVSVRYYSRYTHGVDEKRRVQVPAKWRPADAETELSVILWDHNGTAGACLRVYPPKQIEALVAKIETMSSADPHAVSLRRNIARNCEPVTVDKSGRVCLPEELARAAGIGANGTAVLAGALQWFEIWNPERYAVASQADEALAPESLRQI